MLLLLSGTASILNNLFSKSNTNISSEQKELLLWHQRLGHLNQRRVQSLLCIPRDDTDHKNLTKRAKRMSLPMRLVVSLRRLSLCTWGYSSGPISYAKGFRRRGSLLSYDGRRSRACRTENRDSKQHGELSTREAPLLSWREVHSDGIVPWKFELLRTWGTSEDELSGVHQRVNVAFGPIRLQNCLRARIY